MADIAGLIVGGIGSIAGVVALVYAHIANANAKAANRNAKESTRIANDSNALAVKANDLSKQSNNIALGARELAQEANDIRRRGEARETERHDVHWDGDWEEPGVYVLTKLGSDEARDLTATVVYDGERMTQTADLMVGDDRRLVFQFPTAARDFRDEVRERQRQQDTADPYSLRSAMSWGLKPHWVVERVEWSTRQGNPKLHEGEASLSTFDHFYPN